jgi:hypothetical protein
MEVKERRRVLAQSLALLNEVERLDIEVSARQIMRSLDLAKMTGSSVFHVKDPTELVDALEILWAIGNLIAETENGSHRSGEER